MKLKSFWLLSVCLFVCYFCAYSQAPVLNADTHSGCAPVPLITFTNQSSGFSTNAIYTINFGDGKGEFPFINSATRSYSLPGTYVATLTVKDNGNLYKDTEQIFVYKKPVADFSVSTQKVCPKTNVSFISNSTPGDNPITGYLWDFGDGNPADTSASELQHQYSNSRNQNLGIDVTLVVRDGNGCSNSVTKPSILTVLPLPKVSFTADQTSVCNQTDPVNFTNTTTGGSLPTTYLWTFGDGKISTDVNPVHTYGVKGSYNARLLATSNDGCTDTSKITTITVASSKSGITLPTLLCLNTSLTFSDSSIPQTNTPVWMLDGAIVANDVHKYQITFTDTKPHTLQLINNYGACSDTATKIIQAQAAPVPSPFTVNIAGNCTVPVNATFTDAGLGSTKWEWDFNNANPDNFKPTAFTKSATNTYTTENTYYVKLRVTDGSGCTGEIRQPVIIKKNKTTITSTEGAVGCKTLATTFKATSTNPVAQYNWSFSDDNSTSILDTPQHVFVKLGIYQVKLKIKTTGGCNDSAIYKINIGNEPVFDFELAIPSDTLVCGNKMVAFNVVGDTDKLVGQYYWKFGDANTYTLLQGPTYSHQYTIDSVYDVSLAINNHGCNDTVTKKAFLKVLPSFPKISANVNSCDDRLKVVFKEASKKAQTYSWNFNDGSPVYTYDSAHRDTTVVHYFPKTGSYRVVLTTTNGTCTAKDSLFARVLKKQTPLLTSSQTALCASDSFKTTTSNMDLNPYGSGSRYNVKSIEYENGIPFTGSYTTLSILPVVPFYTNITGLKPGDQKIRLITSSYNFNCLDTTNYIPVQINGPTAGFSIADTSLCLADKIFFNDTSKPAGNTPINSWHWFFGDSTDQILTSGGSIFHKYDNPGNYNAKLVVTDAQNCRDTAYYSGSSLTVKGPKARFSIAQNPILPNTPENFTNLTDSGFSSRINNTYQWDFGDGSSSTSNADKVSHTYKLYSDDTVRLVATSSLTGCSDTAQGIVHVKNTDLSFTYSYADPKTLCPPVRVDFKNTSINFDVVTWEFGDGQKADNINAPSHIYNKPGTFKVTIFGYYDDNTYDSTWDYITIAGPTATLHADVLPGCGSKQVIFTAETQNTTSVNWDFQDGTSSSDSVVSHTYITPNIYIPVLTVKNGPQCVFSYPLQTPVAIDSIHVDINKDSVIQCHQLLVNFKPDVFSIAKNNNQQVDYSWQFGDGASTSEDDTTSFTYTQPGVYPVTFTATSVYGCSDTATVQVTFADLPYATIQGPTEFCENTPQTFSAVKTNRNDVLTYDWTFQNNTSTLQAPPAQTFTALWKDSIRLVVDKSGCKDTQYYRLNVHGNPNVAIGLSDSVSCLGKTIIFTANNINPLPEPVDYVWTLDRGNIINQQTTSYTYTNAGIYPVTFTATSAFGCKVELKDTVVINPTPTAYIQALKDYCIGSPVSLTGSSNIPSSQYLWRFSDGTTSSQQNPTKAYPAAVTDDFYLVVSAGNCSDTAYQTLTVHDLPKADIIPTTPQACLGDSVQLTAHNGQTYRWLTFASITNTSIANPYVYPVNDTRYAVQVTDSYGCQNVDSVLVKIIQPQRITVSSPLTVCAGNKAYLKASGTDLYDWIDGNDLNTTTLANPATTDSAQNRTYTVVGSDADRCFNDTASVEVIVRDLPVVDAGNDQVVAAGTSAQLSATASGGVTGWSWTPTTFLSCSNCTSPVSKLRESTTYTVQATDSYGCKGSDSVHITLICKESLVNVPQVFTPNGDGRNDKFHILAQGVKIITHFVIYGRNGNKVFEKNNINPFSNEAAWDGMSNNNYMPTGTYIYIIQAICDAGEVYNLQGTVTLVR